MIITEEEAKKLWCHQKLNNHPFAGSCLGAQCMAWRWENGEFEVKSTFTEYGSKQTPPDGEGWERTTPEDPSRRVYWERPWKERRMGYCGLAPLPSPKS